MDDINSNSKKPSIPYKPVTPLNAPIQPEIAAPAILPAGDGTGESKWFHLRNQQVFHVYVKKDENLQAEIKHNSPHINLSLSWIVLDENKKEIKTGTVLPGKTAELNIELPTGKGYALAVTGGEGAQAWYSVRILTPHNGLVAPLEPITIFNRPNLLLFFRPFEAFNFYVARTEMQEQAIIRTTTMRDNRFLVQLNSQEVVALNETFHDFELPKGTKVNTISINSPETHIKGTFSQNIWVGTKGAVEPYIFDGPERRIKSK
jgi:hypothetical protein